VEFAVLTVK